MTLLCVLGFYLTQQRATSHHLADGPHLHTIHLLVDYLRSRSCFCLCSCSFVSIDSSISILLIIKQPLSRLSCLCSSSFKLIGSSIFKYNVLKTVTRPTSNLLFCLFLVCKRWRLNSKPICAVNCVIIG
jgi:hypothetical protein